MKKGVVGAFIVLALLVLVSPAIVGRLAEKTLDENLNRAVQESGGVRVTSEHFSRGWLSSEGQHRVQLQDGDLKAMIQAFSGQTEPGAALPVLVINTRLDHGPIPLASMSREQGSLAPGLGSAVSTMQVELADGESIDIPGTIYSKVGLGGELLSNYVLEAGSRSVSDVAARWGSADIEIKTASNHGEATFKGAVGSVSIDDGIQAVSVGSITFDGNQKPTDYGIATGSIRFKLEDMAIDDGGAVAASVQAMSVAASTELDGDRVNANAAVDMAVNTGVGLGDVSFGMAFDLAGADATSLGRLQQSLESMGATPDPLAIYATLENDLLQLFAAGFEMNFQRLNVSLPQGAATSKMRFAFSEDDPAGFTWASLLLSAEATIDITIEATLVDMLVADDPNFSSAISGGFLRKQGDDYEIKAEMKKGLLTVNGAPIPIPFSLIR